MNKPEIAKLLTMCAAYDNRTISEVTVNAWYPILGEYRYVDAEQAVIDHYRTSSDWLMPKHIVEGINRIRAERLRRVPDPDPPADLPDDQLDRWLAAWRKAVADGEIDPDTPPAGEINS